MRLARLLRGALVVWLLAGQPAWSQPVAPAPLSLEARQAKLQAAWKAAAETATRGPASVPLRDEAKLALPADMVFIPPAEASRLMRALGNTPSPDIVGIVTNFSENDDWLVVVRWIADGYVRDDEAKDLDADAVLNNLREGTEEANKERASRGFPELELLGWIQPPHYEPETHRLAWAMRVKQKGEPDDEAGVNLNTRALGRDGYFSLNLLTGLATLPQNRAVSATLLSNLEYNEGKRYADFNASTDKVAEYGLAALIGVVALKKLGIIALVGAFLLKFAKAGALAAVGLGLAMKRLFRRRAG